MSNYKGATLNIAVAVSLSLGSMAHAEEKRIMVFGDSNSWGWTPVPEIVPTTRYPQDIRWPGVMANQLGDNYVVINESLSARTAGSTDTSLGIEGAGLNGLEYLPAALASNMPLDLVVIMLGTNDVKPYLGLSPLDISLDVMELVAEVEKNTGVATGYAPAQVLVVAPPALGEIPDVEWLQAIFPADSIQKSQELAGVLCPIAEAAGTPCFDAGSVAAITGVDGVHMTEDNHLLLGEAIAAQVTEVLQ